jgi:DNA-binding transcriptional LysR family regulator
LRAIGIEPHVVFRTNDNMALQRLVDAGLGTAVVPGLTVERDLVNGAIIIPLDEDIERTIGLAWSETRTPSPALTRFLETVRATTASGATTSATPPTKQRRGAVRAAAMVRDK